MTRILVNIVVACLTVIPVLTFDNETHIFSLDFIEDAEQFAYDYRLVESLPLRADTDADIVIVDIDDESIERHGFWPWRRDRMAEFIAQLFDYYKAKMVILPESITDRQDQQSGLLEDLRDRFYYDNAIQKALDQLEPEYNFDSRLLSEIDGRALLLGFEYDETKRQIGVLPEFIEVYNDRDSPIPRSQIRTNTAAWKSFTGYTSSSEEFQVRAAGSGFTNIHIDTDGRVRSYDVVGKYGGEVYPSIAMEALLYSENPRRPKDFVVMETDMGSYEFAGVKDSLLPITRDGKILLNFAGSGGVNGGIFKYVSATDVREEQLSSQEELADKIVFIGSSSDIINDLRVTPVNPRMPGVEIHALALRNLLRGNVLSRPHDAWVYEAMVLVAVGLFCSVVFPLLRMVMTFGIAIVAMLATYYVNYVLFWLGNYEYYRIVPFFVLLLVMLIANLVTGLVAEYRAKKKVEGVLNQYIPPELASEVNKSKKGFSMEGEIREMSILFSDVRGFTSISERLKPHELTDLMNQMLTALSRQIHKNRGTIDKYIGDAVMAFWNAPLDDPDHAANAVRGAIGMQAAMATLSKQLVAKGMPELKMGVGINSGEACVGNMGSEIRLSYTVMGDTVNLSSRLEGITKQYGVDIIVGERTYELTESEFLYRPVDSVRVKGKEIPVRIFSPICAKKDAGPEQYHIFDLSQQYWEAYQSRSFDMAVQIIKELKLQYPDDGLLEVHLQRSMHFLEAPPPDDWEAITTFDTK